MTLFVLGFDHCTQRVRRRNLKTQLYFHVRTNPQKLFTLTEHRGLFENALQTGEI